MSVHVFAVLISCECHVFHKRALRKDNRLPLKAHNPKCMIRYVCIRGTFKKLCHKAFLHAWRHGLGHTNAKATDMRIRTNAQDALRQICATTKQRGTTRWDKRRSFLSRAVSGTISCTHKHWKRMCTNTLSLSFAHTPQGMNCVQQGAGHAR